MNIIHNNIDITNFIILSKALMNDRITNQADNLSLDFIGNWIPNQGDTVIINADGFTTGIMYIDGFKDNDDSFSVEAISMPINKDPKSKSWNNIRFLSVANDVAKSMGLKLETYGVVNYLFDRLIQLNETDLGFLNRLCIREGYCLKITNGKVVIFDEFTLESATPLIINPDDLLGKPSFSVLPKKGKFEISHFSEKLIKGSFTDPTTNGGKVKYVERVSSIGEAKRFSKGYLRNINKSKAVGRLTLSFNPGLAAGNVINLNSESFIIYSCKHDFMNSKSYLQVRKILGW